VLRLPALFPSWRSATECTGLIQRASDAVLGPLRLGVGVLDRRQGGSKPSVEDLWLFPSRSAAEEPLEAHSFSTSLEGLPSRKGRCDSLVDALVGSSPDVPLPCSSFCPISHGRWCEGPRWQ